MELDDTDDAFVMSIRDNGTAFSPEDAASEGRGIANIKARASMINAVIDWGKRRDRGNRFVLRIPK
jgi:signal transduction histidine kinase